MERLRIAVVTTDIADLAMQGFGSIANCCSFRDVLQRHGHDVTLHVIHSTADLASLPLQQPDLVVAGIKYVILDQKEISKVTPGKIWIAGFLEKHQISFTGSGQTAVQFEFDKQAAKRVLQSSGLPTASFFVATPDSFEKARDTRLRYPLFVKPLYESDSRGVDDSSVVHNDAACLRKIRQIADDLNQPALVETYLPGREFTVAIFDGGPEGERMICPVEIVNILTGQPNGALSYAVKKNNGERLITIDDPSVFRRVADLAWQSFQTLGGRDFGRIDIKMDARGNPFFLEANLLPGMSPTRSYYPMAFGLVAGIGYDELVSRMIEPALDRQSRGLALAE